MTPVSSRRFNRSCTVVRDSPSLRASDATGSRELTFRRAISSSSLGVICTIGELRSASVELTT